MLKRVKSLLARRFRNSQRGQSIVLLAFGFIALAAFVGLVTDISIMFVRFSTLRRAVDSAALAAAGQIREGTDYGTVALAARQYIALHGLTPHTVWVETCETDIAEWRKTNPEPKPLDQMPETDLCDWDNPKKLVKVTAQIESETTFLKLVGIENFIITSSATSETAVLDVALVLDTSTSIGRSTTNADYTAVGVFLPAAGPADPPGACTNSAAFWGYGGCCNDPGTGSVALVGGEWKIYTDANANGDYDVGEDGITNYASDNDYSDLICQPFKQVKDAARNFIARLDFTRGDRVGLVTFDRVAEVVYPNDNSDKTSPLYRPPMMNNQDMATTTLNKYVGIHINETGYQAGCDAFDSANRDLAEDRVLNYGLKPESYGVYALCTNTNVGDGIRRANELLTNVDTIRREAVWVAILLTDGATNAALTRREDQLFITDPVGPFYGDVGFCPWSTFCHRRDAAYSAMLDNPPFYAANVDADPELELYTEWNEQSGGLIPLSEQYPNYPECQSSYASVVFGQTTVQSFEPASQYCTDMDPKTRHFCLEWKNGPGNGLPYDITNPSSQCGEYGHYDADDYARDMADWAGLIELTPTVPGNFIAMFAIGFGNEIVDPAQAAYPVAMPLLHYIADAGDNGQIDNNWERQWRGLPAGPGDPCETITDPTTWCGQYYYANDLASLEQVFEDIASRLFTRLSR